MDGFVRDDAVPMDEAADDRRPRDSLFLTARLRLAGEDRERDVRVRNLSERGMMVELDHGVPTGTRVTVALRNIGPVAGEVVWTVAGRAGIALDRPIDPRRARLPVGAGTGAGAAPRR